MKNFKDKYPIYCLIVFTIIWIFLAIKPHDRFDWFLENLLVWAFVPLLVFSYKKFRLSNLSYTLIFIFLTLHEIGAHYTYASTPFFQSWFNIFDFQRDYYGRFVHFSFGLLFAYPAREMFMRVVKANGFWSYYLPFDIVVALSALYELTEWITALIVSGDGAAAFLGIQGDIFDAQKDMISAASGCLITMVITAFVNFFKKRVNH